MYFARGISWSVRYFSSCYPKLNKYVSREGRMMQKLMKGSLHKKKNWYAAEKQSNFLPTPGQSSFQRGKVTRRMAVLNKLFMKHITDLMATGEVASDILGRGISISRVKVSPDYTTVNVYWLAKGTEDDVTIAKVLSDAAFSLRHELTQLHIMGIVPRIEFVKDKQTAIIAEVNYLLTNADFGEDFEPPDPASYIKSEFTMSSLHLPHALDQVNTVNDDEEDGEPLPPMRMDVLGLNHDVIMSKISKSLLKSAALHRRMENLPMVDSTTSAEGKLPSTEDKKCQKVDIAKYIQKQKILKEKKRRQDKKQQQARECFLVSQLAEDAPVEEWEENEENDYIDEIEDTRKL